MSPPEKTLSSSPSSTKLPLQWFCAWLPAALTHRIPLYFASATIASGVPAPPLPSPRDVSNQLTEWLTILIPCAFAYASAYARSTSVLKQIR